DRLNRPAAGMVNKTADEADVVERLCRVQGAGEKAKLNAGNIVPKVFEVNDGVAPQRRQRALKTPHCATAAQQVRWRRQRLTVLTRQPRLRAKTKEDELILANQVVQVPNDARIIRDLGDGDMDMQS